MTYAPITPFRRTVTAVHVADLIDDPGPLPDRVSKWDVLRDLGTARSVYGVSDRSLTVLQALLSFHPGADLDGNADLVVFPSNAAICERLNGMASSTMRRHLAALVSAGLLRRKDSPNGKRYVRRDPQGPEAYGLDLTPLVARAAEIASRAAHARAEEAALRRLRTTVSLKRRDLAGLVDYAEGQGLRQGTLDRLGDLAALTTRALRRRTLAAEDLARIEADLDAALAEIKGLIGDSAEDLSINDANIEHHLQNSNTNLSESESRLEQREAEAVGEDPNVPIAEGGEKGRGRPNLPLRVILDACGELQAMTPDPIRTWDDLIRAADTLRPMMGVSLSAWDAAKGVMGPETAATVLAGMLERFQEIRSPGGYLRSLTAQSGNGTFSPGPMIMALTRRAA